MVNASKGKKSHSPCAHDLLEENCPVVSFAPGSAQALAVAALVCRELGIATLRNAALKNPAKFIMVAASLIPQHFKVEHEHKVSMLSDEQLQQKVLEAKEESRRGSASLMMRRCGSLSGKRCANSDTSKARTLPMNTAAVTAPDRIPDSILSSFAKRNWRFPAGATLLVLCCTNTASARNGWSCSKRSLLA